MMSQIVIKKSGVREWIESILIAFIIAMIARTFIVQAFKIPTKSMEPTLHGDPRYGDRVLVNKFAYHTHKPQRGDIIVFKTVNIPGLDFRKDYIKRLAGLPGESIEIKQGKIYINDILIDTPNIFDRIGYTNSSMLRKFGGILGPYGLENQSVEIPEGHYFALGDNSAHSNDSRVWGFVPEENLIGKAFMIYWPLKRARRLREQ